MRPFGWSLSLTLVCIAWHQNCNNLGNLDSYPSPSFPFPSLLLSSHPLPPPFSTRRSLSLLPTHPAWLFSKLYAEWTFRQWSCATKNLLKCGHFFNCPFFRSEKEVCRLPRGTQCHDCVLRRGGGGRKIIVNGAVPYPACNPLPSPPPPSPATCTTFDVVVAEWGQPASQSVSRGQRAAWWGAATIELWRGGRQKQQWQRPKGQSENIASALEKNSTHIYIFIYIERERETLTLSYRASLSRRQKKKDIRRFVGETDQQWADSRAAAWRRGARTLTEGCAPSSSPSARRRWPSSAWPPASSPSSSSSCSSSRPGTWRWTPVRRVAARRSPTRRKSWRKRWTLTRRRLPPSRS